MRKLACLTTSSRHRKTTTEMAEETHVLVTRVAKNGEDRSSGKEFMQPHCNRVSGPQMEPIHLCVRVIFGALKPPTSNPRGQ